MDQHRSRLIAIIDACEEEEGEEEGGLGVQHGCTRWSAASQSLRSIRGWAKRQRASAGSRHELQSMRHNVEHAVRPDDIMGPNLPKTCGSGAWKQWTPRRVLGVSFKPQSDTNSSVTGSVESASTRHVLDLKFSVADSVDCRVKQERQRLFEPSTPHCYLIETVMHDETGMKLQPFQSHSDVVPVQNAAVSYCIAENKLGAQPTYYPVPLKLAPMRGKQAGDCLGALCWQLQNDTWAGPPASAAEFVGLSLGSDGAEALQSLLVCLSCSQSFQSIGCRWGRFISISFILCVCVCVTVCVSQI